MMALTAEGVKVGWPCGVFPSPSHVISVRPGSSWSCCSHLVSGKNSAVSLIGSGGGVQSDLTWKTPGLSGIS